MCVLTFSLSLFHLRQILWQLFPFFSSLCRQLERRGSEELLRVLRSTSNASAIYRVVKNQLLSFAFTLPSQRLGLGAQQFQEIALAQLENQVERARVGDAAEHGDDVRVAARKVLF